MRGQAFSGDLIDFVGDGVPGGNQGGGDAVQNCLIILDSRKRDDEVSSRLAATS